MNSLTVCIDDQHPVDIEKKASEIIDTFFMPVVEKIIPETDSLEKIDTILNNFEKLKEDNSEPPVFRDLNESEFHIESVIRMYRCSKP